MSRAPLTPPPICGARAPFHFRRFFGPSALSRRGLCLTPRSTSQHFLVGEFRPLLDKSKARRRACFVPEALDEESCSCARPRPHHAQPVRFFWSMVVSLSWAAIISPRPLEVRRFTLALAWELFVLISCRGAFSSRP